MKKMILFLIAFYRKISFIFPCRCIYTPTCSEYARQAFLRHPCLKAAILSFSRILRCNPFAQGGSDPLTQEMQHKK